MKNYINLFKVSFFFGLLMTVSSCNNEPEVSDISRVTYFPDFTYEGPASALIPCNSDYQISPVMATEQGEQLPVTTDVLGITGSVPAVDITKADYYVETSSAINADGFPGSTVRDFWVACTGDLTTSIEGLYRSTVFRNGSSAPQYVGMKYILIRKVGVDQYEVSNADGGWYQFGRALGRNYASPGFIITAVDIPSNQFTFGPPVEVKSFGGPIYLTSLTVDPATKTIVMNSNWRDGDFLFEATMVQVPL